MNINNNQVQIDKGYKINKVTKTRHKKINILITSKDGFLKKNYLNF